MKTQRSQKINKIKKKKVKIPYYDVELCISHCNSIDLSLQFEAILFITYEFNTITVSWRMLTFKKIQYTSLSLAYYFLALILFLFDVIIILMKVSFRLMFAWHTFFSPLLSTILCLF